MAAVLWLSSCFDIDGDMWDTCWCWLKKNAVWEQDWLDPKISIKKWYAQVDSLLMSMNSSVQNVVVTLAVQCTQQLIHTFRSVVMVRWPDLKTKAWCDLILFRNKEQNLCPSICVKFGDKKHLACLFFFIKRKVWEEAPRSITAKFWLGRGGFWYPKSPYFFFDFGLYFGHYVWEQHE